MMTSHRYIRQLQLLPLLLGPFLSCHWARLARHLQMVASQPASGLWIASSRQAGHPDQQQLMQLRVLAVLLMHPEQRHPC